MRKREFTKILTEILHILHNTGISELADGKVAVDDDRFGQIIHSNVFGTDKWHAGVFRCHREFITQSRFLGERHKITLQAFGLGRLLDNRWWASLASLKSKDQLMKSPDIEILKSMSEGIKRLIEILSPDSEVVKKRQKEIGLSLPIDSSTKSDLDQLLNILEGINKFLHVCVVVEKQKKSDIRIRSIESGSDVEIWIIASVVIAKYLTQVYEIFTKQGAFISQKRAGLNLSIYRESLALYEKVDLLEESGKLKKQEASSLRGYIDASIGILYRNRTRMIETGKAGEARPAELKETSLEMLTAADKEEEEKEK